MPVLPPEPDLFPEQLFESPGEFQHGERIWWVLHTKPRQEKSLARELYASHAPFYLPLIARRGRIRGRVVTSHIPLFGGYLFLLGHDGDRSAALRTNRIVNTLRVKDQEELWQDLAQVHRLIALGAPVTPEDRLAPGMEVEMRSGPLEGMRGKILRTASGRRFVVQVNFIQRGASVEVDDFVLAPVRD